MISLRQRVLWASLMASAAFAVSAQAQQPAALSAPVQAQTAPMEAPAAESGHKAPHAEHKKHKRMDPAERQARFEKRMAERQAKLKEQLKISSEQEAAWTQFTQATQPAFAKPGASRLARVDLSKLSTPERLDHLLARQTERQARFVQHANATKQFYAQLSAEQQKTFDALSFKRGGPRHGHGKHPHHRHPGVDTKQAPQKG